MALMTSSLSDRTAEVALKTVTRLLYLPRFAYEETKEKYRGRLVEIQKFPSGARRVSLDLSILTIGATLPRVLKRDGNRISVRGLDFFDGTCSFDIKGYPPQYRADDYTFPEGFRKLADAKGHV
jgi:hypothetical protein